MVKCIRFWLLGCDLRSDWPSEADLIRCLPRRSASFSPYRQIGRQSTYGLNQNYDWDTHYSFHPGKNEKKIAKLPEIHAVNRRTRENGL